MRIRGTRGEREGKKGHQIKRWVIKEVGGLGRKGGSGRGERRTKHSSNSLFVPWLLGLKLSAV